MTNDVNANIVQLPSVATDDFFKLSESSTQEEDSNPVGADSDNGSLPIFQQPSAKLAPSSTKLPVTFRRFGNGRQVREAVFNSILHSARNLKPVQNQKYTLTLTDLDYEDDPKYNARHAYKARLQNASLMRKLRGTWNLIDTQTGNLLQSRKGTVAQVPYILNNGAIIKNGTQYYIRNQMRLKPGVYAHKKENGELVVNVNALAHEGAAHNYMFDPESGRFDMEVSKNTVPVFTFLKALGASDDEIKEAWGEELFAINHKHSKPATLRKLYDKFVRPRQMAAGDTDTDDRMSEKIRQAAGEISLSPDVTHRTLGHPHTALSKDVVLAATKKLIGIGLGETPSDSRDDMAFQRVLGPEDLFAERLNLDEGRIRRGLLQKLTFLSHNNPDLAKIPSGALTQQLEGVITDSGLASPAEEINPYELYDKLYSITRMGRGSITSEDSIPMAARAVHNSQFGIIDPIRTPESMRVGVDLYVSDAAHKGSDGNLYMELVDARTGEKKMVSPVDLHNKVVALKTDWDKHKDSDLVPAFDSDRQPRRGVPRDSVDYLFPHMTSAFSPVANLVPMLQNVKGQRVAMASRMVLQALPIAGGEAPLVQSLVPDGSGMSYEDRIGRLAAVSAHDDGVVTDVTDDSVTVKYADGQEHTHILEHYSPFNRKTYEHKTPVVQAGQAVKKGDLLARSNATDQNGVLALGLNARTVLIPWLGRNHADAVLVSSSFAKRMASQHMYQHKIDWTDNIKQGKKTFMGAFPGKYNKEQLETINDDGIVKIGTKVMPGDPLVLKSEINTKPTERIHRKGDHTLMDSALEWDHHDPGVVVDAFNGSKGVTVLVKTESPLRVGDKLCYDELTEVCTDHGWKPIAEVTLSDYIACLDDDGNPVYCQPTAIHCYSVGGSMYRIESPEVDLFVTATHNMYVRFPDKPDFELVPAIQIKGRVVAYRTTLEKSMGVIPTLPEEYIEYNYEHPVYCVTVPNHVLFVRRNGKTVWSGNSGRYGNKGVIAAIIPDALAPQTPDGPAELMYNTVGNISRVNPAMIHELPLGKVAKKLGKPIKVESFGTDVEDRAAHVLALAKQHGVKVKDVVIDPSTGQPITGLDGEGVASGYSYVQKLHHSAEAKESARSFGRYTQDEAPARGGDDGAKRVALMHTNALVSHGAYGLLAESKRIRGQKNDEYWAAFMRGYQPPEPDQPLMYKKFITELQGSGINVQPEAGRVKLLAMTDKDVKNLAEHREVKNAETIRWEKDKKPITGGLFDPAIFGEYGDRWGFIPTPAPVLNPVMEEPARRLLGLTQAKLEAVMAGKEPIGVYGTGVHALQKALEGLNIDKEIAQARAIVNTKSGTTRDEAVKRLGFLKSAKETGLHPKDWMLTRIPVIPPRFRAVSEMAGTGTPLVADANYLYKQLIDHINSVKELQSVIGDVGDEHLTTYNLFKQVAGFADPSHPKLEKKRVKGLMRHVFGDGSTKFGIVQRSLLGSPVDMVGRNVIVPNPDLDMDSIGIPVDSAFEIYKSLIIRKLTQRGYPLHKAKEAFENKEAAAKNTLLELTKERPVVMDRAPVLHKFGLMAFWPRLVKGDVLHVNPYVLGGFGADFDGDQNISYVYIRLSLELQDEMMRAKSVSCGFSKKCPSDNSFSAIISSSSSVIVAGEDKKIPILDEELMAGYRDLDVTVVDGEKKVVSICHLSDFPHAAKLYETQGQHGRIDWYAVPDGVEVLSYDEKNKIVVWTKPALFSVHHGCEIEIVTTSSGRQIITDDDPRAIYGFNLTTCEFDRNTPSEARRQQLMIPRARYIPGCEHVTHFNAVTFRSDNNYGHKLLNKIAMDFNLGYLLGVMIGDGWVSDNTGRVNSCQVYLADLKGEVAAKIDEIIKQYIPDTEVVRTVTDTTAGAYGKSIRHSWSATELGQFIKELVGHGCRHKNIPEWSLIAPVEYRQGLFAGLMDTDGGIGVSNAKAKNKPQLMANYTTVSLKLAQTVQVLAATLGIAAHITASKTPAGKPVWYVYFSSADIKRWGGYGLQTTEKRRKIEATPVDISSASLTRHDLVPMPFSLVEAVLKVIGAKKVIRTEEDGERKRLYMKLVATREGGKQQGRISRMVAIELRQILDKYRLVVNHPFWESWLQMCDNPFIVWEYVVDVEKTGQVETGYDLTVPGYETFADVNGVILSNTSNFQVPHSDEALQDAIELMMPSRNLIDPADNKSPAQSMTEDYILGLYDATRTPKNKPSVVRTFATKEDALRDFRRGNLGVHDTVRVLK